MIIYSNNFTHNADIPSKFTCDGEDISPHLKWDNYPNNTQSFVLIIDDPDAPHGTWDHFIAFDIPNNINEIKEGKINDLSSSAKIIKNSWRKNEYGGPCPPMNETHRYYFKIYALDKMLNLGNDVSKNDVMKAITGHVLDEAFFIGKYKRK